MSKTLATLMVVLAAMGCVSPGSGDADVDGSAPSDLAPPSRPTCAVNMTAPMRITGEPPNFGIFKCYESKIGDTLIISFDFGSKHVDVQKLRIVVNTGQVSPGQTVGIGSLVSLSDDHCSSYSGTATLISDAPDWSIDVNGYCQDHLERQVIARWYGYASSN